MTSTLRQHYMKLIVRKPRHITNRTSALASCPQKLGVCLLLIKDAKPKKPNSAKRKIVKLRLSTGRLVRAQLPGGSPELDKFKRVLIRGGRVRDLPGIRYRVIRGVLDSMPVPNRHTSRSKYGVKKK
jgi:small subunit ribosomal protein S12